MRLKKNLALCAVVTALMAGPGDHATSKIMLKTGQTVYVPAYSSIYHGDREREFNLAVTLSVRNTDMANAIVLERADYYDTAGKILKRYLTVKQPLKPLESIQYVVAESDIKGGTGANFVITWHSAKPVSEPIIEAIMIGTGGQLGISFTSRGVAVREK